jgi:hypothetical protein
VIDERSEGRGRACSDMTERVRSKKGIIPRGLPRKTPSGVGCRACPAVLLPFIRGEGLIPSARFRVRALGRIKGIKPESNHF